MGRETSIAWCHHTFNGVHGCAHAMLADGTESPGCENCYAEKGSKRNPKTLGTWGEEGTRVLAADSAWAQLETWHRAAVREGELRRVFCYSIGDVFESPKSLSNLNACFSGRMLLWEAVERLQPVASYTLGSSVHPRAGLIFMLLTKRPENIKRMVPKSWLDSWPQHVWPGTSIENQQAADERIPHLLGVPGVPVRFLSIEPLLERVNIRRCTRRYRPECPRCQGTGRARGTVGWVIAGGESGHHARPCDLAWLRDLRDQCRDASVPFFNKQAGAYATDGMYAPRPERPEIQVTRVLQLKHPKGEDPAEWPEDLRVRQVPHV